MHRLTSVYMHARSASKSTPRNSLADLYSLTYLSRSSAFSAVQLNFFGFSDVDVLVVGLACASSNLNLMEFHLIASVHLTELRSHLRLLLELSNLRHPFRVEAAFVVDIDGNIVLPCMLPCWILAQM